jgi:hypothetical protein
MANKPVYLDEGSNRAAKKKVIVIILILILEIAMVAYMVRHWPTQSKSQQTEACEMLAIAFDEAQMSPSWYETAGKVLQACGNEIDDEDITRKVCHANRWNGYESEECTTLEKSSQ